jgi:hypothetical protein
MKDQSMARSSLGAVSIGRTNEDPHLLVEEVVE